MKIAAIVRSYHLTEFLKPVLKNISWVDKIVLANYRFNRVNEDTDNTYEIYKELAQDNIEYIKGENVEQAQLFNDILRTLPDYDYVMICDADEIILREDWDKILKEVEGKNYDAIFTSIIDYAKVPNVVLPARTHKPVVLVKPSARFVYTRGLNHGNGRVFNDVYMHHFGYALSDIEWKSKNIWYEKETFDNLLCQRHIKYEPPKELLDILEEK